ncbi:hypothetical protein CRE_05254 [Caenorhabditis remanei]|uniref:F-box domain-containing protein n=1 Tax=Caenorhabditis remanei TaxID=31234 RepID=E3NIE0_CAERE|nr:hypothetical protein CRE_05254 [Caenorhabditis remanei]
MSSPFPLLRLPRLVLFDVFKSLSIGEKIKLSLCSKKIFTQINSARLYSQTVIVDLDCLSHKISVHFENDKETFDIFSYLDTWKGHNLNTQQFSITCCTVAVTSIQKGIQIFWKNRQEGFLSVIQHLSQMFQCKISTSFNCHFSDLLQPTISKLFDLQLEFKILCICLDGSKDEDLFNQISGNLKLVEYLSISSSFNTGFEPVFTSWPQKIIITSSAWFTLEYLLACTSTTITLGWAHLGNKDLDEILKNWKAGEFPNLERLKIQSRNITSFGATILGMNLRELVGKVIQTDDGSKKATIKLDFDTIEMSVTSF